MEQWNNKLSYTVASCGSFCKNPVCVCVLLPGFKSVQNESIMGCDFRPSECFVS